MASKRKSSSDARRCSRDLLVKALYQWQIASTAEKDLVAQFSADDEYSSVDKIHFKKLLKKSIVGAAEFDATIERLASRSLAQLDAVGRAILLIALAELAFFDDVPTKVAINEAVDLAKRYGATDSYKFVNAVLDKAAREIRGESRV